MFGYAELGRGRVKFLAAKAVVLRLRRRDGMRGIKDVFLRKMESFIYKTRGAQASVRTWAISASFSAASAFFFALRYIRSRAMI